MNQQNLFVTVEGMSGSGKTTIANELAVRLGGRYYKTPPPLLSPIRAAIDDEGSALSRYLYYCAGIAQASADIQALLTHSPVVCDKYLPTVLAYSRAAGPAPDVQLHGLIVRPTLSVFLDVPDSIRWHRIELRGAVTPQHERFLRMEVELGVRSQFQKLELLTVDNRAPSPQQAAENIWQHLLRLDTADRE